MTDTQRASRLKTYIIDIKRSIKKRKIVWHKASIRIVKHKNPWAHIK